MSMLEPESSFEDRLNACDPARSKLLAEAKCYFESELFSEFRDDLHTHYPGPAKCSPTAIFLIGYSYYQESNWDAAKQCIDRALELWRSFASIGTISQADLKSLEEQQTQCRKRIEESSKEGAPKPKVPLVPHLLS